MSKITLAKNLFPLILCLFPLAIQAEDLSEAEKLLQTYKDAHDGFSGKPVMNGIRYLDYTDFFGWDLVTVRYRQDNNEQRFTYANKLAWESLQKKTTDYPDGSVFIKVGYIGQPDPAFTSSVVPSGLRRVQIMVRNKEKYKTTDGWGYALFKFDGTTMAGDPTVKAEACAACHRIVPDRGYVFSQPIEKKPVFNQDTSFLTSKNSWYKNQKNENLKKIISFEEKSVSSLPDDILMRTLLPKDFKKIRMVKSNLTSNFFVGSFNEIIPSLVREVHETGLPAAMLENGNKKFSLVYPLKKEKGLNCQKDQEPFFVAMATPPFYLPADADSSGANLEVRKICLRFGERK